MHRAARSENNHRPLGAGRSSNRPRNMCLKGEVGYGGGLLMARQYD
jgi:hypothetical protein